MTSHGGRAVQSKSLEWVRSHHGGQHRRIERRSFRQETASFVVTPQCTTQRTQQSQSISKFHRIQMNLLSLFPLLVEQDWCETILEQILGPTSVGLDGVFSDLKERFHGGRTPGCQWSNFADGSLSSKSLDFICSHRRWSDLFCSRRCPHHHPHQTLETLQYTSRLVKTVVKEIMKVESSKQISSLACCPMTVDSKTRTQHFVAPAISTAYPIIQEDAHRRLNQQESRALDLACEEGRTTARTMYLAYTWNLVTLILDEWSTLSKNTCTSTHHCYTQKISAVALVRKVRDGDFMRLLLGFFMNRALVFKLISLSGGIFC